MRTLALIALLALAACTSEAKFRENMQPLKGQTEDQVIARMGLPQQVYETEGKRHLTYSSRRSVYLPGQPPSYQTTFTGNTAYTSPVGGTPGVTVSSSCTIVVTIDKQSGLVEGGTYRGNACRS